MAKSKFKIDKKNLEILALSILNNNVLTNEILDIGEKVRDEVEAHSDNSKKFNWQVSKVKTGDRMSVRIGSNDDGASRYEFFSGTLFNAVNKNRS